MILIALSSSRFSYDDNYDRHAGVQGTAQPLACVPGGRLPTCVCNWTPTTVFIGHRHVPHAANQHTFSRSLIRCCWTSIMEQSVNPAARVRRHTRTFSMSTQNASIWSLTAAAPSDSVFRALCINCLTYLLTYKFSLFFRLQNSCNGLIKMASDRCCRVSGRVICK